MDEYAVLMMLGVRVREVRDLREGSLYVYRNRLLLVDPAFTVLRREQVAAHYLPLVLRAA